MRAVPEEKGTALFCCLVVIVLDSLAIGFV